MNKMTEKLDFKSQNEGRVLNFVSDVPTANIVEKEENNVEIYLVNNKGKSTNEDKLACAKKSDYKVNNKPMNTYFIRQYATGEFKNQFYNPLNYIETDFHIKNRNGGEAKYKWVKVTKLMYELYLKYLTTRNNNYLSQVNQEQTRNG